MATRLNKLNVALQVARRFYSSSAGHEAESAKTWKNVFFVIGLPVAALAYYNAFYFMPQHPEREEFVPYSHLRIRTKPFPWGDGNHTLFHHQYYNALPEGYEEGSEALHGHH